MSKVLNHVIVSIINAMWSRLYSSITLLLTTCVLMVWATIESRDYEKATTDETLRPILKFNVMEASAFLIRFF